MKRMVGCLVVALIGSLFLMASPGGANGGDRLPYLYISHETTIVNVVTGEAEGSATGECAYGGRFTNTATGHFDFVSGDTHMDGTLIAADGSLMIYEAIGNMYAPSMVVTFTSGTGRFSTVSGQVTDWVLSNQTQNLEGDILTLTFDTRATGWISF